MMFPIILLSLSIASSSSALTAEIKTEAHTFLSRFRQKTCLKSSNNDASDEVAFKTWFSSVEGAKCSDLVSHDYFDDLRGLAIRKATNGVWSERALMTIPNSVVLKSDFSESDWDAKLASELWMECLKGSQSKISGYVSLLTKDWGPKDLPSIPPSTAPDALRHSSNEDLELLKTSSSGQKLLDLQKKQEAVWKKKFEDVRDMTWEQFEWAMEVVHSRSFCGNFGIGGSALPPAVTTAIPAIAGAAGFFYYAQLHGQSDIVLLTLGALAAFPVIANIVSQDSPSAVLLPLIDSANHLEEADSSITYSALDDAFTMIAGGKCIIEENGKKQLYISYGKKKDTELLLNYGFLPDIQTTGDRRSTRTKLAEAFISRQSS